MVQEVASFKASDGNLFETMHDALCHEVKLKLLAITGGNEGVSTVILSNRAQFFTELQALMLAEEVND